MTITKTKLALYVLVPAGLALGAAGFAAADSKGCNAQADSWQSKDAALQVAQEKGWSVEDFEIEDGCYGLEGRTADGEAFEVKLDPANLAIIRMEMDEDDDGYSYGQKRSSYDDDDHGRHGYGERHDDDHDDDDDDDDDDTAMANPAPSGAVAPPQNGLFNNGTAPKVEMN